MAEFELPSTFPHKTTINTSTGTQGIEILSKLGTGGFSDAFLAKYQASDEKFVIKFYKKTSDSENNNPEAQILGLLRTTNASLPIVNIIEPKILQDRIQGHIESLAKGKKLQDQIPSHQQALQLAIRFAELLKTCAMTDIAYRDIKPGDHVMWEPIKDHSVESMTVIDWNISQYPATVDALYFDLTKFCGRLPEFFTGIPPKGGEIFRFHPLAWKFDEALQDKIPLKLWLMLANLTLEFVIPITFGGEQLLSSIPFTKESLLAIWDKVIQRLKDILALLDSQEFPDSLFKEFDETQRYYLKQFFVSSPTKDDLSTWTKDVVYDWAGVDGIRKPSRFISNDELLRLRLARLLNPGEFREEILLSVFVAVYRTGVLSSPHLAPIFQKLLQGLINNHALSSFYNKEDLTILARAAREIAAQQGTDTANIHGAIWDSISKEFETWMICEQLDSAVSLDEIEHLTLQLDSNHPTASYHLQNLRNQQSLLRKKREIDELLSQPDLGFARMQVKKLRDSDAKAADEYEHVIELCERIENVSAYQYDNLEAIKQLAQEIGTSQNLPQVFATKLKGLQERVPTLEELNTLSSEIHKGYGKLKEIHPRFIALPTLSGQVYAGIKDLETAIHQKFTEIKTQFFQKYHDELAGLDDVQRSEKLKFFDNTIVAMIEVYDLYGEQELVKEYKQLQADINDEMVGIDRRFKDQIKNHKRDLENLLIAADSVTDYELILAKLKSIGNDEKDLLNRDKEFKTWLHLFEEKTLIFLSGVEILKSFHQRQEDENALLEIDSKLEAYSDDKKSQSLRKEIQNFRDENDLRFKTLANIEKLDSTQKKIASQTAEIYSSANITKDKVEKDINPMLIVLESRVIQTNTILNKLETSQKEAFGELEKSLENEQIEIEKSIKDIMSTNEEVVINIQVQVKQLEKTVIALRNLIIWGLIGMLFCILIFVPLATIAGDRIAQSLLAANPTATPTLPPALTETPTLTASPTMLITATLTDTPTITETPDPKKPTATVSATATITATPTITVTVTEAPIKLEPGAEMVLKTKAIFYDADKTTKLWEFSNERLGNIEQIKVTVLEPGESLSFVKMQILIASQVMNDNLVPAGVNVRTLVKKDATGKYEIIGLVEKEFQIEKDGNLIDDMQPVFFTAWVTNQFLEPTK